MPSSDLLELAHKVLYWPHPQEIWEPSGAGAKIYAKLAEEKIGKKIKRECQDADGARVSVLSANPTGGETEAPIAIICKFPRPVSSSTIKELYRLAWSFSRTRSLITIEPQLLRVWSCCEPPEESKEPKPVEEISQSSLSEQAATSLQWVNLVSGNFFEDEEHRSRFKRTGSADQMLLSNLKEVRRQLSEEGLEKEVIHDLIARIIFVQFLFQKKDDQGVPALSQDVLQNLYEQGVLSEPYTNLPSLLENFNDTYNFFYWLNNKFNGDLFPGKGGTKKEREREWRSEIEKIRKKNYLRRLADFVRGDLEMQSNQRCLWPQYSFDVIPLEFISSIYEEFVSKQTGTGVHYTPEHIVDFILDGVLPWEGDEWNLKILDPACGSGIFLVKAFQRLIYRWEKAHHQEIQLHILKYILKNNLFGVDIDKDAIRVASFSLYLTMIDNINPRRYWDDDVRFPKLRGKRLITADFFQEDIKGFRTDLDAATYDLVIGNAPWGKNTVENSIYAASWQRRTENDVQWKISYGNIGLLFLPKAAKLTKEAGRISMMQPAMPLLFNHSKKAKTFRENLFSTFKVEEVVNLSTLRFGLFKDAISPTCIITICPSKPDREPFAYICPKPNLTSEDDYRVVIEHYDVNWVYQQEVLSHPFTLITLIWGSKRDVTLLKRLRRYKNLDELQEDGVVVSSQGIIRGNSDKVDHQETLGRIILEQPQFPEGTFLYINPNDFPDELVVNENPWTHRLTSMEAFQLPQLIIKLSWIKRHQRFKALMIDSKQSEAIVSSGSYLSVHAEREDSKILHAALLTYNSIFAVYYLLLSSGRFANYLPEIKPYELLQVPLPELDENFPDLANIKNVSDVDKTIRDAFAFKESEWTLIQDLFAITLPDFKGDSDSPGRQPTQRVNSIENTLEPELTEYCNFFIRVLKAGFGQDKSVCGTIFQEQGNPCAPVRLLAIHLNQSIPEKVRVENVDSDNLLAQLNRLNDVFLRQSSVGGGGIYYQRVTRVYDSVDWNGKKVPTIYLIKPDKVRYWTCSMALRDADEVVADIMMSGTMLTE